jgi:hypothetical protein
MTNEEMKTYLIKASSQNVVAKAEIYSEKAGERKLVAFAVATVSKVEAK